MNNEENLNESEISLLKYFWQEKQDLDKFSNFEKLKPKIQNQYPILLKVWENYKLYNKLMDIVINSL